MTFQTRPDPDPTPTSDLDFISYPSLRPRPTRPHTGECRRAMLGTSISLGLWSKLGQHITDQCLCFVVRSCRVRPVAYSLALVDAGEYSIARLAPVCVVRRSRVHRQELSADHPLRSSRTSRRRGSRCFPPNGAYSRRSASGTGRGLVIFES